MTGNLDATDILRRLMALIQDRQASPPPRSYTAQLLSGGAAKIGEKVLEEAAETVEAGHQEGSIARQQLIHEAADLVYHLLVLLAFRGIALEDVEAELARRFGVSGLDEKARRR